MFASRGLSVLGVSVFLEGKTEGEEDDESVGGENRPAGAPAFNLLGGRGIGDDIVIHDLHGENRSDAGTETVGHNHEKPLRTAANVGVRVLVHIERAGDVEEVKRHAIDQH